MNGNGNLVDWVKEKLGMGTRYPIVAYLPPKPVPVIPPMATAGLNVSATEVASLVAGSGHPKSVSNDNRSSLISGR